MIIRSNRLASAGAFLLALLVSGCGHGSSTIPASSSTGAAKASARTSASLVIKIPTKSTASGSRAPAYISAATVSAQISIVSQSSGAPIAGYPQNVGLTATSSGCASTLASTQCTLNLALLPGSYTISLTTYDGANATGSVLSAAQAVPFTVVAGSTNVVQLTLGGVPTSLAFIPDNVALANAGTNGLSLVVGGIANLTVLALDADSNVIVGAGAPSISVTSSDPSQISVVEPTAASPNLVQLTSLAQASTVTLNAAVTPLASTSGTPLTQAVTVEPIVQHVYGAFESAGGVVPFDVQGSTLSLAGAFPGSSNSRGITYDAFNGLLYTDGNSGIHAFDLQGNAVTISGGSAPQLYAIAFDPDTRELYAVDGNTADLYIYDEQGQLVTTVAMSGVSAALDIAYCAANHLLYVGDQSGANDVKVVNASGVRQTTSGTFSGASFASAIACSPQTGRIYVGNIFGGIHVYDLQGNTQSVSGSFAGPAQPNGVAYDAATRHLYFSDAAYEASRSIYAFDLQGNIVATPGGFAGPNFPFGIVVAP